MLSSGIRFNDCFFTEPIRLDDFAPPKFAGLFVILTKDGNWAPKPYQPVYFGEFGNNTPHAVPSADYARIIGVDSSSLFISVLPMPFSTTAQRWALRTELLSAYNPSTQVHEVQVVAGAVPAQFQPMDVGPRRRIGFLP